MLAQPGAVTVLPQQECGLTQDAEVAGAKKDHPKWVSLNHAFFPGYPFAMGLIARPLAAVGVKLSEEVLARIDAIAGCTHEYQHGPGFQPGR